MHIRFNLEAAEFAEPVHILPNRHMVADIREEQDTAAALERERSMEGSLKEGGPPVAAPDGDPLLSVALSLVSTEAGGFQVHKHKILHSNLAPRAQQKRTKQHRGCLLCRGLV